MMDVVNPYRNNTQVRKMLTVIGVYIGMFGSITIAMGNSILLPMAAQDIGGEDIYSLAASVIGPISVATMPLFGFLGAKFPTLKRTGFVVGFLLGVVALLGRTLAPNMLAFIIPSVLIGFASAALYTFGYTIIRDCFSQKQAGIYLGFLATMLAVGSLVGPVLTGGLIELASWRFVTGFQATIFLIAAIIVFFGARITKEEGKLISYVQGKFDLIGALSLSFLLASLIVALSLGGNYIKFGTLANNLLFAVAAISLVVLIITIRRKRDAAIVPLSAFKNRNTIALFGANFFSPFSSMALSFFLPMFLIYVLGTGAGASSIAMSCYAVVGLFLGPIFGRWVAKSGTVKPIVIWFSGAWRVAITIVFIFVLVPGANIYVVYFLMLLAGLYASAANIVTTAAPQVMIEPKVRQQSNALIQLGQTYGGVLSIPVYTAIITAFGQEQGMTYGLYLALAGAVALMICGIIMKKPDWNEEKEQEDIKARAETLAKETEH
ncbi:MAG: MFS transporter [Coriobacteriales bacterium]|nr:MFS transporter [Coriobacteriales bacterium]